MTCVLFSRPADDSQLNYLHYYSKELVELSEMLGHKTINKELQEANKATIISLVKKQKPRLIMFNGHGSPEEICGHKQEVLVSTIENSDILKGTITYTLSCSSALVLGPKSVEEGAVCFIGYESDFALGKDPESEASPRYDKIAKLFLEPSNLLFSSLLRGQNVKISVKKAKQKMADNISYLNTTKSFPEAIYYAPFLFGNYMSLTSHGNQDASIDAEL